MQAQLITWHTKHSILLVYTHTPPQDARLPVPGSALSPSTTLTEHPAASRNDRHSTKKTTVYVPIFCASFYNCQWSMYSVQEDAACSGPACRQNRLKSLV
jgi:hypothetical protein